MAATYEDLADRAEQAAEELDIRAGLQGGDGERPLAQASQSELEAWAGWDPEEDEETSEPEPLDLPPGVTLRPIKRRSTARRRLEAEPEGEMPKEPKEKAAPATRTHHRQPTPPKRVSARLPLGSGLAQILGALGVGLIVTGRDPGVGMALQFEAPIAGEKLDHAIEGTLVDRFAQPLARAGKAGKDAGAVLALPFLVGLIERRPELYHVLKEPLLRPLVVDMALELEEAGERAKKRLESAQRKGSGRIVDSDALLAMLFEGAPPPAPGPEAPDGV